MNDHYFDIISSVEVVASESKQWRGRREHLLQWRFLSSAGRASRALLLLLWLLLVLLCIVFWLNLNLSSLCFARLHTRGALNKVEWPLALSSCLSVSAYTLTTNE